MNTIEKLTYMANQIARNFANHGDGAAEATAHHLARFWDPGMRAKILARLDEPDRGGLSPIAAKAVASLADKGDLKS
ncbi:MAG TPA: formate dehydrogenase subunit delta [Caulobacteraceae bacterium]|jgi:formate dehydrogenase subunit delta|nr:formate dehydrogenase subunit delta [Caulobacteraceae bacterium]